MLRLSCILLLFFGNAAYCAEPIDPELDQEARQLAQRFIGELKPQLKRGWSDMIIWIPGCDVPSPCLWFSVVLSLIRVSGLIGSGLIGR